MVDMSAIDIARRMAELGEVQKACQAYTLAGIDTAEPELKLEAAVYILQNNGNYQVSYDLLLQTHKSPEFENDAFEILTEAFYLPNEKILKNRYEKTCRALSAYPYLFRKDFPAFEDLPIRFYPYDDERYVPFDTRTNQFGDRINFHHEEITRNFFKDLQNPILAQDVYSQYELEYLNDNVRASEDIGRENHIYLHYTHWEDFCSHLMVIHFRNLIQKKKLVILIEDEASRYPLDFQKEFGIDYSKFPLKPPSSEEFTRMIWHTQLSSDNGGDFFNEIMDSHPNLVLMPSMMFYEVERAVKKISQAFQNGGTLYGTDYGEKNTKIREWILDGMSLREKRSQRGHLICMYLFLSNLTKLDVRSRIAPVIFFQPHFHNIFYDIQVDLMNRTVLTSNIDEQLQNTFIFKQFPYIKTFTPMRRVTYGAAATLKFEVEQVQAAEKEGCHPCAIPDCIKERILNRSFMVDWQSRLFKDSRLVRFEDGKLNPLATFTALAAFLDLPYTESMTYCSNGEERDPETFPGNALGFSLSSMRAPYYEYLGKPERYLMEYCLQDVYRRYGYDFEVYDGAELTMEQIQELQTHCTKLDNQILQSYVACASIILENKQNTAINDCLEQELDACGNDPEQFAHNMLKGMQNERMQAVKLLQRKLRFVNQNGQPLNFMPMLQLDPDLLETYVYHEAEQ